MAVETSSGTTRNPIGAQKGFVEKAWDTQHRLEKRWNKIGSGRYARVLKMARKPAPEEFRRTSIVVALGLGVIGLVGFIVFLLMELLIDALGIA